MRKVSRSSTVIGRRAGTVSLSGPSIPARDVDWVIGPSLAEMIKLVYCISPSLRRMAGLIRRRGQFHRRDAHGAVPDRTARNISLTDAQRFQATDRDAGGRVARQ